MDELNTRDRRPVLKLSDDIYALTGLAAYVESCEGKYPALAAMLRDRILALTAEEWTARYSSANEGKEI